MTEETLRTGGCLCGKVDTKQEETLRGLSCVIVDIVKHTQEARLEHKFGSQKIKLP